MENQEYERDDQLLEARRLKRLEQKRRRKMQQRIILGVLALVIVLALVLIIRGCSAAPAPEPEQIETPAEPIVETEPDTVVTLAAVGDIMIYDDLLADALQEDGSYNFADSFSAISMYTSSADLAVGNLELNFCGEPYGGKPDFRAPEALAQTLKDIGFDILQTANTYSIQNGISGLSSTIKYLNTVGIDHVGTYAAEDDKQTNGGVLLKNVNGVKIAFFAYTKGLNNLTLPEGSEYAVDLLYKDYSTDYSKVAEDDILDSIAAAKALNPDIIVAMMHWGSEYDTGITETQEEIRDLLLDNDVDIILGSHSHVVGPMVEQQLVTNSGDYKNTFVAYSLGNFYSSQTQDHAM
ncbi:MAG: CapA family protein, partial [Oscillospiraceae bacterium]|nr:CapA family protein [Oscillospiraceae bacterium]